MNKSLNTLIVLVGPTASGKTEVAIQIAHQFNAEIISADSRQFYKELPIGTAAPNFRQLKEVKHHCIGNLSVKDEFNVSSFENTVLQLLEGKFKVLNNMILVGGSGLYINAVCRGIDNLPDPDINLRREITSLYEEKGIRALQEKLNELDPQYYQEVDRKNPKRLMRAIEVCLQTGKPYSEQRLNQPKKRDFNIIKIGLEIPRTELNDRINGRTKMMMDNGWLEEARSVFPLKHLNALNTVGYKELFKYIEGEWTLEKAIEKIQTNTRRYAKRQMTWFKKDPDITWFSPEDGEAIIAFLKTKLIFLI